jgi:hypothetical protein
LECIGLARAHDTAPGHGVDFVSRFFAPASGVAEDPVTGSAHCCLAAYWRKQLNKDSFVAYQASPRGGVLRVTLDSVEEFRTTTTGANADMGRTSGAQISLVTRSGTNELHGAAYEYHRNTVTAANDWFNNRTGVARPARGPRVTEMTCGCGFCCNSSRLWSSC